ASAGCRARSRQHECPRRHGPCSAGASSPRRRTRDPGERWPLLFSPPAALALDVFALSHARRGDDEDLEALRPGLVAPPRAGRDANRVPLLEVDDLVVELQA